MADYGNAIAISLNSSPASDVERDEAIRKADFRTHTDHMAIARYSSDKGWHGMEVTGYAPLQIDPCATSLNWGQSIFEAMTAFLDPRKENIVVFKPWDHIDRLKNSATAMKIPKILQQAVIALLDKLLGMDSAWIPEAPSFLYIRVNMIGTSPQLMLDASEEYLLNITLWPGQYRYSGKMLKARVNTQLMRSCPNGVGDIKQVGNYGPIIKLSEEAREAGFDQNLHVGPDRNLQELDLMNFFTVIKGGVIRTSKLNKAILPGKSRSTVMVLLLEIGKEVEPGDYSYDELIRQLESGEVEEVFASGTGAGIVGIGQIGEHVIGDRKEGSLTRQIREEMLDIRSGKSQERQGWLHTVPIAGKQD